MRDSKNIVLNMPKCPFCPDNDFYLFKLFFNEYNIEYFSIYKTTNFMVLPDIAPLVEGHLLIIPLNHYCCFGKVLKKNYKEFQELKDYISELLTDVYTKPIFFEHGPVSSQKAGASINHAHIHCLPSNVDLSLNIKKEKPDIPNKIIPSIVDLCEYSEQNIPYLFYESKFNKHYIYILSEALSIPSQYLRKIIAKALTLDKWDWKEIVIANNHKNKEKIIKAVKKLKTRNNHYQDLSRSALANLSIDKDL